MPRLGPAAMLTALLLLGTASQAATLAIHGSTTVSNAVIGPHKDDIEKVSGITLDIVSNGSGRGLSDLAAGKTDIAMISAPLDAEVAASNAKTPGSLDLAKLVAHQIGEARVAFIVHPSNQVTGLTMAQITDILTGKTTNWSALGGSDTPIVVVAANRGDGVRSMVESRLLAGGSILSQARELPNAPQIVQVTAQLPAAFGLTSAASLRPGVTTLKTDVTIAQPLILVTMGIATPEASRVIEAATAAAR